MYGCENWIRKKAECWRIDAFELWCWRKTLPLDGKETKPINPKGNQPWIFIGRTDAKGEAPKFGHLIQRANSLEKTVMLGKTQDKGEGGGRGFSSVTQSCPSLCDPMNYRPPCPSTTPRVHSDSRPSSPWCHPAISSSVVPFSSCPQTLPASESFPMSQLFAWSGQSIGVSASTSVLPKNTQGCSPLEWTGWISLQSKGLSRVFSNTTVQKHQFFSYQLSSQSISHILTWPLEKP